MLKKIKKEELIACIMFCLGFLVFLSYNLADNAISYDRIWTFHMTQKIAMGYTPYSEINIIITPLFYQLGALLFNITGQANFFMYSVYGGIIGGFIMLLCYKIIKEFTENKSLAIVVVCSYMELFITLYETSYNTLLFALVLGVVYLEIRKEKKNKKTKYNIWIGVLAGLCAATKHTVGGVVLIATILFPIIKKVYLKEEKVCLKEVKNKILGILIVAVPYFVWLLLAGNLKDFIDLAILGMFDFAEKNTSGSFFSLFSLVGAVVCFSAILIFDAYKKKNKVEKELLILSIYAIATMSYSVPLFNFYHVFISQSLAMLLAFVVFIKIMAKINPKNMQKSTLLILLLVYILLRVVIILSMPASDSTVTSRWTDFAKLRNVIYVISLFVVIALALYGKTKASMMLVVTMFVGLPVIFNMYVWKTNVTENGKNYIYEYASIGVQNEEIKDILEVNSYILEKEQEGYKVLILDIDASKYMVPLHRNNYKFDLLLNGNLGFDGEERILEELENMQNLLILRQRPEDETIQIQQVEAIDKFVEENYEKIGEIGKLEIYN